jgi:hypothetical protein
MQYYAVLIGKIFAAVSEDHVTFICNVDFAEYLEDGGR